MVIIHIFFQNPNLWNTLKKFATASIKSTAPQKLNRSCFKPKHVWKIRIIFRSPKPTNVAFHSQFCISPSFESPFGSQQEAPPDLNNVKPPINDLVEISGHNFGDGIELLKVKVLWLKNNWDQYGDGCSIDGFTMAFYPFGTRAWQELAKFQPMKTTDPRATNPLATKQTVATMWYPKTWCLLVFKIPKDTIVKIR